MNIADQPITTDKAIQTEPTFDLEQTILDLVMVVEAMGYTVFSTPQQAAAMQRLRDLAQSLGMPVQDTAIKHVRAS
jgi:hypothetical protein